MPSYTQYLRQIAVVMDKDDDIEWITVKGNHIPIKKGENKEDAIKSFFESKSKGEKSTETPKSSSTKRESKSSVKHTPVDKNKSVMAIVARAAESAKNPNITEDYIVKEAVKTGKYTEEQIKARINAYEKYKKDNTIQTIEKHTTGGHWDEDKKDYVDFEWKPERIKDVWKPILNTEWDNEKKEYVPIDWDAKKPAKGERPKLVILGGRGGSGKSHFTDGSLGDDGYDKKKFLVIDPDSYKERLPEYKDLIDKGSEYGGLNAWEVHEESSAMKKAQLETALKLGVNVVLDGTLAQYNSTKKTLDKFKNANYIIDVAFMELPREKSAVRGLNRGMGVNKDTGVSSGRWVPQNLMLKMTDCEDNFVKLAKDADHWVMYDNDVPYKTPPKFVAKGGKND